LHLCRGATIIVLPRQQITNLIVALSIQIVALYSLQMQTPAYVHHYHCPPGQLDAGLWE
jgi:hypothetical protein